MQLNCADGVVIQSANVIGSDIGGDTQDNRATFPTPLPEPGPCGGHVHEYYANGCNYVAILDTW